MNAAENPLLDPVVWVILTLCFVAFIAFVVFISGVNRRLAAMSLTHRLLICGVVLLAGIFGVLLIMLMR